MKKKKTRSETIDDVTDRQEADSSAEPPIEDVKTGPRLSVESLLEAACDARTQAEEAVMALVPPEVTEHLVRAQKEFLQAGMRVGEILQERLEEKAGRARAIHEELRARKADTSAEE